MLYRTVPDIDNQTLQNLIRYDYMQKFSNYETWILYNVLKNSFSVVNFEGEIDEESLKLFTTNNFPDGIKEFEDVNRAIDNVNFSELVKRLEDTL